MIDGLLKQDLRGINHLQPTDRPDIMPFLKFYCSSSFCLPVKYSSGNRIVGISASIIFGSTAWLAHIIVSEEMRNRGIGFSITKFLLDHLQRMGIKSVSLIATRLGEPLYRRIGFEPDVEYIHFKDVVLTANDGDEVVQFSMSMERDVLKLDKEISGEERTRLLSPHLSSSKVFINTHGSLEGVFFPSLGEGLIAALTEKAGTELLKHKHSLPLGCGFPVVNNRAMALLNRHGYVESGRRMRMRWGDVIQWQPKSLYNRIGGNLG